MEHKIEIREGEVMCITDFHIKRIHKYASRIVEDIDDGDITPALCWADTLREYMEEIRKCSEIPEESYAEDIKAVPERKSKEHKEELKQVNPLSNIPEAFNLLHNVKFEQAVLMLNKRKSCMFEDILIEVSSPIKKQPHLLITGFIIQNRRLSKKVVYPHSPPKIDRARIDVVCHNTGKTAMIIMVNKGSYRILKEYETVQKGVYKYRIAIYADDVVVIK